jgi:hypothetical protein
MYDFYFGTKEEILKDEIKFLLTVKRMMPRWCNSIPDSEFTALHNDLKNSPVADEKRSGIIVETGCGASTVVLAYHAFRYNKKLYTWDINQNKLSYIRSILVDTLEKLFARSIFDVWQYIPYLSTSQELGISIVRELGHTIDFAFFDSEHTSQVLLSEIDLVLKQANDGAVLALDDANYNYKYRNIAYINVFRKKMGLAAVACPPDNITDNFYVLAERSIKQIYPKSFKIADTYKSDYRTDIFWEYFSNDRQIMNNLDMEKMQELEHRYDSFKIVK